MDEDCVCEESVVERGAMSTSFPLRDIRVRLAGATDVGRKRSNNEDRFFIADAEPFALVADGMGGHAAGEVAATLAVEQISAVMGASLHAQEEFWPYRLDPMGGVQTRRLRGAIRWANQYIYEQSQTHQKYEGMGTTVVSTLFFERQMVVAHVGDSRLYRLRKDHFQQLTEDHSLQNSYAKQGAAEAAWIPKNMILRALGIHGSVQVDVREHLVEVGDVYLLCSDGLTDMVSDEQIRHILQNAKDLDAVCEDLIGRANHHGGVDNVTVVVARIEEVG